MKGLQGAFWPPLVEKCGRCKGSGADPEDMDIDQIDYLACRQCYGTCRQLTDYGRAVCEAFDVRDAIVDGQLDARYGLNNPNDPRNFVRRDS